MFNKWSNSSYEGPIVNGWYEGVGRFTFADGVVYEGEFKKGEFHGKGTLVYPKGGKYKATWERGKILEGEYEFYDGLMYDFDSWNYCTLQDRRFYTEKKKGLQPSHLIVNHENGPEVIPHGTYDVGDGYYEPSSNTVFAYQTAEIKREPDQEEIDWIMTNCRYNPPLEPDNFSDDDEIAPVAPSQGVEV